MSAESGTKCRHCGAANSVEKRPAENLKYRVDGMDLILDLGDLIVPICQICQTIILSQAEEKALLKTLFDQNSFEMWFSVFDQLRVVKHRLRYAGNF